MQPPPISPASQQPNGLATAGLVCGILSPFLCAATAIPAIILGHISLSKIKSSGGALRGSTASAWALVLGYGSFILIPIVAALVGLTAPLILRKADKVQSMVYQTNMQTLSIGFKAYQIEKGTDTAPYPSDIRQLESMGYVDRIESCLTVKKKHAGDWLYFSTADSENPDEPLLISPKLGNKRLLLEVDGNIREVDEAQAADITNNPAVPPTRVPAPTKP